MGHVVFTGPIRGEVTLPDGRVVDVNPHFVEVEDDDTAAAVAHAIGERYAAEGHPHHVPGDDFVYTPKED